MAFSELNLLRWYPYKSVNPVLIDVGAHQGDFSLVFARKDWFVIAFEPEHKNRSVFLTRLSNFSRVTCYDKAVTDECGNSVPFYVSEKHFGIHSLKPFHKSHVCTYEVQTVTLDKILIEHGNSHVSLLKVDTEGADFLALKGFDVRKYKPEIIMVEFMDSRSIDNFSYSHHDVVEYMGERGYTAFVSEWAPIEEYGREGETTASHRWLGCTPYPLDHQPSWGNLIFVPEEEAVRFNRLLKWYIFYVHSIGAFLDTSRDLIRHVPGAKKLYRLIRRN